MIFKILMNSLMTLLFLTSIAFAQSNFVRLSNSAPAAPAEPTKPVSIMDKNLGIPALNGQIPKSWKVIHSDLVTEGGNTSIRFFATSQDTISKFVYLQQPSINADLSGENALNSLILPQTKKIADGGNVQVLNKQFSAPQQIQMAQARQFTIVLQYQKKGRAVLEAHSGTILSAGGQYGIMLTSYAQPAVDEQTFVQNMQRIYSSFKPNPQWMQAMQQQMQQQMQGGGQFQQQQQFNPYQQQQQFNPYQQQQFNPYQQ